MEHDPFNPDEVLFTWDEATLDMLGLITQAKLGEYWHDPELIDGSQRAISLLEEMGLSQDVMSTMTSDDWVSFWERVGDGV